MDAGQSANRHAFAMGNPLLATDPSGHFSERVGPSALGLADAPAEAVMAIGGRLVGRVGEGDQAPGGGYHDNALLRPILVIAPIASRATAVATQPERAMLLPRSDVRYTKSYPAVKRITT